MKKVNLSSRAYVSVNIVKILRSFAPCSKLTALLPAISLLLMLCNSAQMIAQIVINEGSNKNYQTLADEDGDYPDWIELYNSGTEPVNLFGYTLSDRIDLPAQWEFPAVNLEPGQFMLVYCSAKNRKPIGPFQQVLNATNYIPVAGWNSFPLDDAFEWDGVSSLLINTCSYSSTGYTVNATFSQSATAYPSTVYNFQDGSDAICSAPYGSVVNQRPNIRLNGLTIGAGNIMNSPTDYPAPFGNWYWAARHQMIIPASELIAVGLSAGPINNFALRVVNANGSINYDYFNVAFRAVVETQVGAAFTAVDANANLHTNFKISGEGETIYLFGADQILVSELFVGLPGLDLSTGSQPDAGNSGFLFGAPTPGSSNNSAETFTEILLAPEFSMPNGIYTSVPNITITHQNGPLTAIHYTTDGSEPTVNDPLYNAQVIPIYFSSSLKAKAFEEGKLPSKTATASYLMGVYHHTPILSLTTDNANLYGDNGIFDNWWTDWKRLAHAAYFDEGQELIFAQSAGIQIDGGAGGSRYHPQHSFRLELAHSVLGENAINYAAIPNRSERTKYSNFYFRNGSNMYQSYPIKDAVQVECMAAEGQAFYSAWRPVTVYINGNYFGLYEMREKIDMEFFRVSENAHPDSTDLLSLSYWYGGALRAVEGSVESFIDSYEEFNALNPMAANYWQAADAYFDLESYCDYIIAESWMANTDWPWNNIKIYRSNKSDFRWRFGVMDLENGMTPFGWTDINSDMINYIRNGDQNIPYINVFVQSIENPLFRKYFINRYADMMNTSYRYERLEAVANDMFDQTILEMPNQYQRWGDPNNISGQMQAYVNNHNAFLNALSQRTAIVRNHIESNFNLIAQVDVSLDVFPANAGKIKISTVVPESLPWTGVYFHGNPVRLTAHAKPGYAFAYWEPNQVTGQAIFEPSIEVDINSDVLFTAVFVPTDVEGVLLISEINFHSADELESGDWIELFNAGNAALDLSNWKVKDANPWDSFIWPAGSTILPGERIILASDPVLFNQIHPAIPVNGILEFNLSNGGESITVFNSINDTILSITYDDTFPWQPAADGLGRTLELRPDFNVISLPESWFAGCIGGSPGTAYSPCNEQLIVSELNYRSAPAQNAGDWIELYNATSESLSLNGWRIQDSQSTAAYYFGDSQIIPAGGYLVLYNDATAFSSRFPDVSNIVGPMGFQLSNEGEELIIFNAANIPVYTLVYDVVLPWPADANGGGYTMELLDYQGIACDGNNWIAGCPEGSPGSAYALPCLPMATAEYHQYPAPVLYPNPSDGLMRLSFGKAVASSSANSVLTVYNTLGVQVHQSNHPQGSELIQVDLSSLQSGFYLVSLRHGEQRWQWKWVLE